jgi:hypothetical protein
MSEAEFERRLNTGAGRAPADHDGKSDGEDRDGRDDREPTPPEPDPEPTNSGRSSGSSGSSGSGRSRGRSKPSAKARRVQRMFAIEEELDKKLWLYAIHVGKDRSDVVNDLLRPVVASMVLYDSRDRRSNRSSDADGDAADGQGGD